MLPDVVSYDDIKERYTNLSNIPIGLNKETLNVENINLVSNISYLLSMRTIDDGISFIDKLIYILSLNNTFTSIVFDSKFIYDEFKYNTISYINNNYLDMLTKINNYSDQIYDVYLKNNSNIKSISSVKQVVCVIIGIDKFFHSLKEEKFIYKYYE